MWGVAIAVFNAKRTLAGTFDFAQFAVRVFGKFFGKKKLCPKISPKKSVEGAIGGVVGAVLLNLLLLFVFKNVTEL